jgi:hypothetical protein
MYLTNTILADFSSCTAVTKLCISIIVPVCFVIDIVLWICYIGIYPILCLLSPIRLCCSSSICNKFCYYNFIFISESRNSSSCYALVLDTIANFEFVIMCIIIMIISIPALLVTIALTPLLLILSVLLIIKGLFLFCSCSEYDPLVHKSSPYRDIIFVYTDYHVKRDCTKSTMLFYIGFDSIKTTFSFTFGLCFLLGTLTISPVLLLLLIIHAIISALTNRGLFAAPFNIFCSNCCGSSDYIDNHYSEDECCFLLDCSTDSASAYDECCCGLIRTKKQRINISEYYSTQ